MAEVSYPLDTTGTAASNLVVDEPHTLTEVNDAPYRILIPTFSPFYLHNLAVKHVDTAGVVKPLVEGVDFYCALPYMVATRSIGKPLYGGLAFISTLPQGTILVTVQTLGGEWCADAQYVYKMLLEKDYNAGVTWWDTLTNVQQVFPPTPHALAVTDIDGISNLIAELEKIRDALVNFDYSPPAAVIEHIGLTGNVHGLTKRDLGLENVQNYEAATDQEVIDRAPVDKTITLRQLLKLLP